MGVGAPLLRSEIAIKLAKFGDVRVWRLRLNSAKRIWNSRRLGALASQAPPPLKKSVAGCRPQVHHSLHERLSVCCCLSRATMPRDDEDKRSLSPLMLDDSLSSSSHLDSPRFSPVRFTSRRRRIAVTVVAFFSVFSLLYLAYLSSSRPRLVSQDPTPAPSKNLTPSLDRKSALLGPPTSRFRGSP